MTDYELTELDKVYELVRELANNRSKHNLELNEAMNILGKLLLRELGERFRARNQNR